MAMHRCYVPPDAFRGPLVTLPEREAHHALHVLRLGSGQRVSVLDGAGHEYLCEVTSTSRHEVTLRVLQKTTLPRLACQITLVQAVTKGRTMETIVQKATELGVSRIVPVLSERTVAHLDAESTESRREKWELTAIEAVKQCGLAWLPAIENPLPPAAFLARNERSDLPLVASLQPGARHPRAHFQTFADTAGRPPASVLVWVGPEGDFTPAELQMILGSGALPITLGPQVLRSDTAATYCLSVISYELQAPGWATHPLSS